MEFNTISVTWQRPEYKEYFRTWEKVRDAAAGEKAIKNKRELYLPRLMGQDSDSEGNKLYDIYLEYAYWYGASARTLAGLRGLVFRKDPLKNIPEVLRGYEDNITADGQSIMSFTKDVLMEVLQTNRCGIFIDFPEVDTSEILTKSDMEQRNVRPYTRMYRAENIINWRTAEINNETVTTLVVLSETIEVAEANGFEIKFVPQYRVLYLDEDNTYCQRIYQMLDANPADKVVGGMTLIDEITPIVNGSTLNTIPFFTVTDKGITWDLTNSTILALVNTNISHYRNSANREQALIWTGNPTPVFSGYVGDPNEGSVRLGSTEAILLGNGGTAGFLEFTGQGIDPIKLTMLEKKEEMAVLGARIVAPEKRSAETAESASIHRAGEQGVLADIANSISDGLTRVLRFFGAFHEVVDTKDIWIKLNTDFMPIKLDAESLDKLGGLVSNSLISWETFIYQLQQGEILPLGVTADDEYDRIVKNKERLAAVRPDQEKVNKLVPQAAAERTENVVAENRTTKVVEDEVENTEVKT